MRAVVILAGEPSSSCIQLDVREHQTEDGRAPESVFRSDSPGGAAGRDQRAGGAVEGHRSARC